MQNSNLCKILDQDLLKKIVLLEKVKLFTKFRNGKNNIGF